MVLFAIRCWFENSEEWLESIPELNDVRKEKMPGGKTPGLFLYDYWVIYCTEEKLNWLREYIRTNDYDVEIEAYKQ